LEIKNESGSTFNTIWDIVVDDNGTGDFEKIQDALDASEEGDTIFVKNGFYKENLLVKKSINLIGENKFKTIVDGGIKKTFLKKHSIVIEITAENVEITGFTFQNATGIDGRGIYCLKKGGRDYTSNNSITNNIIKNCSYGLMVANPINNTIANNSFYGCSGGYFITKLPYYENIFYNNTVNDKPLLFYSGKENFTIEGEAGFIEIHNCKNVTIKNISTSHNTVGIDISFSHNITVINCTLTNTSRGGIYVHYSENCKFVGNTLKDDNWGIFLRKSNNNKILNNNFINITKFDWFARSFNNQWDGNYWEKPIKHPKLIFGKVGKRELIPWFNIDWNPAEEPN
jgi:parallel beta-helix repeat protein